MPAVAGYLGRIKINTVVLRAHRWSIDWKVDDFDVTTFENNLIGIYLPGITDFTITADAYWDTTDNPFKAPLLIAPGSYGSLQILLDKTSLITTKAWNFPNVLFDDVRSEAGARDVIRYNFTAKASGYTPANAAVTVA